jgi:hypothetical protein
MLKKSTVCHRIQDLKGNDLGYIRVRDGVTTVVWIDTVSVSMTFVGPASVIFGKIVVECDGKRVIAPKAIAPEMDSKKKTLDTYVDRISKVSLIIVEGISHNSGYNDLPARRYTVEQLTTGLGLNCPGEIRTKLMEGYTGRKQNFAWL